MSKRRLKVFENRSTLQVSKEFWDAWRPVETAVREVLARVPPRDLLAVEAVMSGGIMGEAARMRILAGIAARAAAKARVARTKPCG